MSRKSKHLLVLAALISAASALPTCGVHDPDPPLHDGKGGAAGKASSGGGTAGTTGGNTAGSGSVGVGGSSFDFGGSSGIMGTGTGGANTGGGGTGGAGPDGGSAGGVSGSMCGKVTLMMNDTGHIASILSDLLALINGPNAATDPYALAATGGGGHTHVITFNDAQVTTLRNGGSVTVMSTTTEAHGHSVTVTCTKK